MGRDLNSYRQHWQNFEKFRGNTPNPGGFHGRRGGPPERFSSIFDLIPFSKKLVLDVVFVYYFFEIEGIVILVI